MTSLTFYQNNFLNIFIFLTLVALSVLLSDLLKKKSTKKRRELYRKIPHILIGIIFALTPSFLTSQEIIIGSIILVLGIWIGKYSPIFKSVFSIKRITYGMWLTPLSLGVMAFLWLPDNQLSFLFGILVLTFSDALAALVGKYLKGRRITVFKKSLRGSTAFFITTIILLYFLSPEKKWPEFIFISSSLTFLEFILIFGLDNLFLPIIASILFNFLLL